VPDDFRSPIKHHRVLHGRDSERGVARFYNLMIEQDLFGRVKTWWSRLGIESADILIESGAPPLGFCSP
jgi:hypothetical protein